MCASMTNLVFLLDKVPFPKLVFRQHSVKEEVNQGVKNEANQSINKEVNYGVRGETNQVQGYKGKITPLVINSN